MFATLKRILAGNVISQLIGLISLPVLSLGYQTADLGYYGVYFSFSAIASAFISLRIENLLFASASKDVSAIERIAIAVTTGLAILTSIIVLLAFPPGENRSLWLASLAGATGIALFNIVYCSTVRLEKTRRHVNARVGRAFIELLIVCGGVFWGLSIQALIWIIPVSYFFGFFALVDKRTLVRFDDLKKGLEILRHRLGDVKYDLLASILNSGALYAPTVYFFFRNNQEFSGLYFAVTRYLGAPTLMIAQGVGTTLKQYASAELEKTGKCTTAVDYVTRNVILRLVPFYLVAMVAASAIAWFLEAYHGVNAFFITCILLPLFFVRYVFNCVSSIVYVLRLQRMNMIFQGLLFFAAVVGLVSSLNPLTSIIGYALLSIIVYAIFLRSVLISSKN